MKERDLSKEIWTQKQVLWDAGWRAEVIAGLSHRDLSSIYGELIPGDAEGTVHGLEWKARWGQGQRVMVW